MTNASTLVTKNPQRSRTKADQVAKGLGWFSLGLGLVEMIAPGKLGKALNLQDRETLLRSYGAREMGAGVWALSDTPAPAIWSRVAGDVVDLGTLAYGFKGADEDQRRNLTIATGAVAGVTLVDILTALSLTSEQSEEKGEKRNYSDRSGFPKGASQAQGAASEFETPGDMRAALPEPRISGELEPA